MDSVDGAEEILARHLQPGVRVAVGDGAGMPVSLFGPLSEVARAVGDVDLLLGWMVEVPPDLDLTAFSTVVTFIGGFGLRGAVRAGSVRYVPARLGSVPALLHTALRPDVLLVGMVEDGDGLWLGSEASWMPAAIDTGANVIVEINHGLPRSSTFSVTRSTATVAAEVQRSPLQHAVPAGDSAIDAIADAVVALIPNVAVLQYGPGPVGPAVLRRLESPVRIRSGVIGDEVVDLADRGLLDGDPSTTYLLGSDRLYTWANARRVVHRLERTHDLSGLADLPLVAINGAVSVDHTGQVNVEFLGHRHLGGVGGHPDFAAAAARSPDGLSIVALPSRRQERPTLVDALPGVSTPRYDVDVLVTERGVADLRGRTDAERTDVIGELWH